MLLRSMVLPFAILRIPKTQKMFFKYWYKYMYAGYFIICKWALLYLR